MLYGLYSVRDLKVGFLAPMVSTEIEVTRLFEHEVLKTESLWNSHHEDFVLFQIGSFDTETGDIDSITPVMIDSASAVISRFREEK